MKVLGEENQGMIPKTCRKVEKWESGPHGYDENKPGTARRSFSDLRVHTNSLFFFA